MQYANLAGEPMADRPFASQPSSSALLTRPKLSRPSFATLEQKEPEGDYVKIALEVIPDLPSLFDCVKACLFVSNFLSFSMLNFME